MQRIVAALAIMIAGAFVSIPGAAAQTAEPIEAHLECFSGSVAIKHKKKVAVTGDLDCIIRVTRGDVPGDARSDEWTVQPGLSDGPHLRSGHLVAEGDTLYVQFESPLTRLSDFAPCHDFKVHAEIVLGGEADRPASWEGELAVKVKCAKPKKVKAKLACAYTAEDGARFTYPGTGTKAKPRLEAPLTCSVTGRKKFAAHGFTFVLDTGRGARTTELSELEDLTPYGEAALSPEVDFDTCLSFTVKASIQNDVGQTVWSSKQKIAQDCPD